ncbi:PHP domain-containing protein [Thermosipho ferrireducens]|uniref:PHP domain-containing protein n=2 Tax=Thermosipho ferrireducens TaxID=2571116 RepID=A0ABX7SA94_9BACT|nr:PHP domain-containing protein [Thermosipho ferrireducens]
MVPSELAKLSAEITAITDHNSGGNVEAFSKKFSAERKLIVPGIEIQTIEDVHILGYFPDINQLKKVTEIVYQNLPEINYDPEKFGYQIYTDENDKFTALENLPLGFPISLSLESVIEIILKHHGVPVYAHINRKFGVMYQLGLIPDHPVNIAEATTIEELGFIRKKGLIALSSSDAHFLNQLNTRYSIIECEKLSLNSFFNALVRGKVKTIWDL